MTDLNSILENKQHSNSTVQLQSVNKLTYSTVQYSREEVRGFLHTLDARVFCNERFLPFYHKAAQHLGFSRLHELERIAVDPSVENPEKMFSWLIKQDLDGVANRPTAQ